MVLNMGRAKIDEAKLNDVERDLVEGLGGLLEDLQNNASIPDKYTCRGLILDLVPRAYTADDVRAIRSLLRVSQALFAKFLGVSPKTVSAWEQGKKVPSELASRFMDEIHRNPEYWQKRVEESAVRT